MIAHQKLKFSMWIHQLVMKKEWTVKIRMENCQIRFKVREQWFCFLNLYHCMNLLSMYLFMVLIAMLCCRCCIYTACGVWGLAGRKNNPSEENCPGLLKIAVAGYVRTETEFISRTFNCFYFIFGARGPGSFLNILNILQCRD